MDSTRRRRYLNALGIDAWQHRDTAIVADSAVSFDFGAPPVVPAVAANPDLEARHARQGGVDAPQFSRAAPTESPGAFGMPRKAAQPSAKAVPATAPAASRVPVPTDWPGLRAAVANCERCKLCSTRTNTVFGVGHAQAPLMVVGEGPGADEDAQGEPFVGRAGKLLDEMLRAIDRSRKNTEMDKGVFIANVVKCRPPGNRDPEPDEVEACRPYLDQQIKLVKPRLIIALGKIAAMRLLETDAPLSKLRGGVHHYGEDRTPVMVTYHPAYLLRSPGEKAKSWQDLKRIHQWLEGRADQT